MAIFGDDESDGLLDRALGSVDESVARQFDDTPGGGFVDEPGAVLDPTQRASEHTERDVRAFAPLVGGAGILLSATSASTTPDDVDVDEDLGDDAIADEYINRRNDVIGSTADAASSVIGDARDVASDAALGTDSGRIVTVIAVIGLLLVGAYSVGQLFTFNIGDETQ